MPRVSNAEKQKSHRRIVEVAARLFREQGIEATGLAEIMSAAGMTHGGFYRHFANKDELVREAFDSAFNASIATLVDTPENENDNKAFSDYLDMYLSLEHVSKPGIGCPIAAIGSELQRQDIDVAESVKQVAMLLGKESDPYLGYARLSMIVGAVTLARLMYGDDDAEMVLEAATRSMS